MLHMYIETVYLTLYHAYTATLIIHEAAFDFESKPLLIVMFNSM